MKQYYYSKMQLKGLEKVFLSSFVRSRTLCRVFADRSFLAYALNSRIFLKKRSLQRYQLLIEFTDIRMLTLDFSNKALQPL